MGMTPKGPSPNNPSDGTPRRVESLARIKGRSRSERWFRSLVQYSSDLVMILNADGTVRYVSPAAERVLGYRPEEMVGTLALGYVHPEDVQHMSRSFAQTLEKPGVHPPVEYRVRAADGSWRYMEAIRSNWLDDPHIAGVVANVRDLTERKRAEERFRSLVQNSSDVITVVDVDGTILYDSPTVERVLGYKPEERVGTNAFDYIGPGEAERVTGMIEEILASPGARLTGEMWWPHKDGSFRYLEVTPTNLHEDSAVRGIVINTRDITEQKEAEKTLKESEVRFRSLVQNASDVILIMGPDQTVRYVSPAVERVLGYKPEQVVGHDNFTPVHPDDMPRMKKLIGEVMGSPGITTPPMELRLRHADGSWRYVETACTNLLGDPAVGGIVFNIRDVTERKRTEEALQEAEAKYRTLVEQLPAITYVNTHAQINHKLYVSPQIESILGVSVAEWTSEPRFWITLLHPEDRERVLAEVARSYERGEPLVTEYRMIARDGRVVWFRDEATPVRDDAGRFYYHHGVMLDVTERKEAEEERVRQARQAALRADVSAAFAGGGTLPRIFSGARSAWSIT